MNIMLCFPSLYLHGDDIKARDVALTIRKVSIDVLKRTDGGEDSKPCLYFEETLKKATEAGKPNDEKRMVLNKTNAKRLVKLFGKETDDWVGKKVTLTTEKVEAFGEVHDAIRVKES